MMFLPESAIEAMASIGIVALILGLCIIVGVLGVGILTKIFLREDHSKDSK